MQVLRRAPSAPALVSRPRLARNPARARHICRAFGRVFTARRHGPSAPRARRRRGSPSAVPVGCVRAMPRLLRPRPSRRFCVQPVPAPHTLPAPDLSLRRPLHPLRLRPLLLLRPLRLRPLLLLRPLRPLRLLRLLHPLRLRPLRLRPLRQLALPLFFCPRAFSHMVHAVMHTLSYGYSGRRGMDTCTGY